jgi:t-SNARE complex subunit (syntaxin)
MNIFTEMISDYLGINMQLAEQVQNQMEDVYNIDWSEATEDEIEFYADLAFQDLNETVNVF